MDLTEYSDPYKEILENIKFKIQRRDLRKGTMTVKVPLLYDQKPGIFYNYEYCVLYCVKFLRDEGFTAFPKHPNFIVITNLKKKRHNPKIMRYCSQRSPVVLKSMFSTLLNQRQKELQVILEKHKVEREKAGIEEKEQTEIVPFEKIVVEEIKRNEYFQRQREREKEREKKEEELDLNFHLSLNQDSFNSFNPKPIMSVDNISIFDNEEEQKPKKERDIDILFRFSINDEEEQDDEDTELIRQTKKERAIQQLKENLHKNELASMLKNKNRKTVEEKEEQERSKGRKRNKKRDQVLDVTDLDLINILNKHMTYSTSSN